MKRRATKLEETTTPCESCGFPISHRHHLMEYAEYGENDCTLQACATCHWTLHICVSALGSRNARAWKLWSHLLRSLGEQDQRIVWAQAMESRARDIKLHHHIYQYLEDESVSANIL